MQCPECGSDEVTSTWECRPFLYGVKDPVQLVVHIPVQRCRGCTLEWTDWVAEVLHDAVVQRHLESLRPGAQPES